VKKLAQYNIVESTLVKLCVVYIFNNMNLKAIYNWNFDILPRELREIFNKNRGTDEKIKQTGLLY